MSEYGICPKSQKQSETCQKTVFVRKSKAVRNNFFLHLSVRWRVRSFILPCSLSFVLFNKANITQIINLLLHVQVQKMHNFAQISANMHKTKYAQTNPCKYAQTSTQATWRSCWRACSRRSRRWERDFFFKSRHWWYMCAFFIYMCLYCIGVGGGEESWHLPAFWSSWRHQCPGFVSI